MNIQINKFEDWLRNKNLKERTIENYIYYFNKFIIYDKFNQESLAKFLSMSANRNSIGRAFLVNFKKFLMKNRDELKISPDYYAEIIEAELPQWTGRAKRKLVNPIPHEQIFLLEKALENEKLRLMLLLSYYGALRTGELMKIRILSFNWGEWKKDTTKIGECRVYGKGAKEGIALIKPELMKRVARYIRSNEFKSTDIHGYLFIKNTDKTGTENRSRVWQRKLSEAGIKTGLTQLDSQGNPVPGTRVYPHRLRHSYASHLLKDLKLNIRYVQEYLRHSSIVSTQIYTYINKEELKKKLEEIKD